MPWAEQIAEEPQWSSRLTRRRKLQYFSLLNDKNYYLQYLMALNKKLPINAIPVLYEKHASIALFSACRGENRALKGLILEAIKESFYQRKNSIDSDCFIKAYSNIWGVSNEKNPFCQDMLNIEISEVVENSNYNPNAMPQNDMLISRVFSEPKAFKDL